MANIHDFLSKNAVVSKLARSRSRVAAVGHANDSGAAPPEKLAVLYCEGFFGDPDGKTANGLVRHSKRYKIIAVIDSRYAGMDSGTVLDKVPNGIPIRRDMADVIAKAATIPSIFVYGIAPADGQLPDKDRQVLLNAMKRGMSLVSGLHYYLNDSPEFVAEKLANGVLIDDVRKPPPISELRTFTGAISNLWIPRIAVLGTDCAIGKRTTATILTNALNEGGIKAVLIATGQTGIIQGEIHAAALDAIPSQFCAGALEGLVLDACDMEKPDVVIIEGQGALSHPAYCTSAFILRGSQPHAVILQHAPARRQRCDFPSMSMPNPRDEIEMIEAFSDAKVIGLTISHEGLAVAGIDDTIAELQQSLKMPVTDALERPTGELVSMALNVFPNLRSKWTSADPVA